MAVARALSPFVFLALLLATLFYVLWRGERAERACVATITIGSILSAVAAQPHVFQEGEIGIFLVDLAVLAAFVVIMGLSNRFWPIWIAALQIIAVATHLARFLQPQTVPMAYAISEQLWVLPMQVILAAVVWRRQPRRTPARNVSQN